MSYDEDKYDPLCCCEYFDINNERNHLLACLCNCVDLDQSFDNLISGRSITSTQKKGMLLTFQDRLRIPWKGGAKRISLDNVLPIILLPALLSVAAINLYCSFVVFLSIPAFLGYCYYYLTNIIPRTKFFLIWTFCSAIYLWIIFQSVVPLYELLPEENLLFVVLISVSFYCFYKVKKNSFNYVQQSIIPDNFQQSSDDTVLLISDSETKIEDEENSCQNCHKNISVKNHCSVCQCCINKPDQHNYWLDCCIGSFNRRYFVFGCIFAIFAFLLNADLSLTSICHPFIVFQMFGIIFILPDDCSEVYDEYDIAIGFVASIYSLLFSAFFLYMLLKQFCVISRGNGGNDLRKGELNNKNKCLKNWKIFICSCDYLPF